MKIQKSIYNEKPKPGGQNWDQDVIKWKLKRKINFILKLFNIFVFLFFLVYLILNLCLVHWVPYAVYHWRNNRLYSSI